MRGGEGAGGVESTGNINTTMIMRRIISNAFTIVSNYYSIKRSINPVENFPWQDRRYGYWAGIVANRTEISRRGITREITRPPFCIVRYDIILHWNASVKNYVYDILITKYALR